MAKKLEDLLLADGWSQEELAASPLLQDARFRSSLEKSYGAVETERDFLSNWRETTANPHIADVERREIEARQETARLRELVKIAKEYGVPGVEESAPVNPNPNPNPAQPPRDENGQFVTRQFMNEYGQKFVTVQRAAMAQYVDISNEHQRLFGKPIESFESILSDMDNLPAHERGRLNLKDVWARKYNVDAKRAEIKASEQKAHDDKIRKEATDEVEKKYAMQRANPLLASPVASRQPFIPARAESGKQPWEQSRGDMRERRLNNALERQHESTRVN